MEHAIGYDIKPAAKYCTVEYKEDSAIVTKNSSVVVKRVPAPKTGGLLAKMKALDAAAALQSTATYGVILYFMLFPTFYHCAINLSIFYHIHKRANFLSLQALLLFSFSFSTFFLFFFTTVPRREFCLVVKKLASDGKKQKAAVVRLLRDIYIISE